CQSHGKRRGQMANRFVAGKRDSDKRQSALTFLATSVKARRKGIGHQPCDRLPSFSVMLRRNVGGMRRRLGRRSKARATKTRVACVTKKYPFLEDCGKTKRSEWSSVTFWSWPCAVVRRRGYFCSVRKRTNVARWEPLRCWHKADIRGSP